MVVLEATLPEGVEVGALALRCQVRIEPQRLRYSAEEAQRLYEQFGEPSQWGDSLRPFLVYPSSTVASRFVGSTQVELPLVCTYDFEVAGAKYLASLSDGDIPLVLLFSGTVFSRGPLGLSIEPIPWDLEALRTGCPSPCGGRPWTPTSPIAPGCGSTAARLRSSSGSRASHGLPILCNWPSNTSWRRPRRQSRDRCRRRVGSARPSRWPTPSSTRGTCSIPTGPPRPRTGFAGSSACSCPRHGAPTTPPSDRRPAECLVRPGPTAAMTIRVRFLQQQERAVEAPGRDPGPEGRRFVPVERLEVDGTTHVAWDEAVDCSLDLGPLTLEAVVARSTCHPFQLDAGMESEPIAGVGGMY